MPTPKRKTSKSRRDQRQSCKFIRPGQFAQCTNCAAPVNQHQVCGGCGFYKGRKIMVTRTERIARKMSARRASADAARNAAEHAGNGEQAA